MRTPYEPDNGRFSDRAHEAAQSKIYPLIFDCSRDRLSFESTLVGTGDRNSILDGEMGVDRIVKVEVENLHSPLVFTVQERFRRPEYMKFQDVTVTEWNNNSNLPSELYKINSGLFVYGYFDEDRRTFLDAIAVPVSSLLVAITKDQINYIKSTNRKNQDFIGISFSELKRCNLIIWRAKKEYLPEEMRLFA